MTLVIRLELVTTFVMLLFFKLKTCRPEEELLPVFDFCAIELKFEILLISKVPPKEL